MNNIIDVTPKAAPPPKPTLMQRALMSSGIAKLAAAVSNTVANVVPQNWFGPGQPLTPVAPKSEAGRLMDYRVNQNINLTPRNDEFVSMWDLYMLAENYDIVRLLIETRKDQVEGLSWKVRVKAVDGDDAAKAKTTPDQQDRIKATQKFLEKPDGETPFPTWIRMILEDCLVYDAVSLYQNTDDPIETKFQVISGMTVKRIVDEQGRTPAAPSPAYQQIIHGLPAWNYSTDQMIYAMRNPRPNRVYGMSPVQQIVMTVNIALRKQISQLEYFTSGNIPDALINVPEEWTPAQIAEFQTAWDILFEGNTAQRRHAKFVPGGTSIEQTKPAVLKDEFDEWLTRVCCYAFSIPPTAFTKSNNRATAQTQKASAEEEGLAPLLGFICRVLNTIVQERLGQFDLEFAWAEDEDEDPQTKVALLDTQLRTGAITLDEYREAMGRDPYPDGTGAQAMVYTGSGATLLKDILNPPAPPVAPGGALGAHQASHQAPGGGDQPPDKAKPGAAADSEPPAGALADRADAQAQAKKTPPATAKGLVQKGLPLKTCYISRPLINAEAVIAWAKDQGFETTLPADDMHATIAYSRDPIDWDLIPRGPDMVRVSTGSRSIETLGEGAVVLKFGSLQFYNRWQAMRDIGASWDYPTYKSHVTISFNVPPDLDLDEVLPYDGVLIFGPEVVQEIKDGWKDGVTEKSAKLNRWKRHRELIIPY